MIEPGDFVDVIGPCTNDARDCEIMRAAIALKDSELDNERAYAIRLALAEAACKECRTSYLADIIS